MLGGKTEVKGDLQVGSEPQKEDGAMCQDGEDKVKQVGRGWKWGWGGWGGRARLGLSYPFTLPWGIWHAGGHVEL